MSDSGIPTTKEQLVSQFDRSVATVQVYADELEQVYARPALRRATVFFNEQPIASVFLFVFLGLAFFPILTFLTASVLTVLSLSLLALGIVLALSCTSILFFFSILALILIAVLFVSIFTTTAAFSSYSAYRLVVSVRSAGREGVWDWVEETKGYIINQGDETDRGRYSPDDTTEDGKPLMTTEAHDSSDIKEET
ncbi:unnamed protein product [Mycena citricolor]|uniref:Uncharacterized protein n=1 Tax=Mycena citricolor TaxID=2018698 RepID=A0AAD2HQ53_9AGAR|nr:unnamed protein product [Mycena citricolor]